MSVAASLGRATRPTLGSFGRRPRPKIVKRLFGHGVDHTHAARRESLPQREARQIPWDPVRRLATQRTRMRQPQPNCEPTAPSGRCALGARGRDLVRETLPTGASSRGRHSGVDIRGARHSQKFVTESRFALSRAFAKRPASPFRGRARARSRRDAGRHRRRQHHHRRPERRAVGLPAADGAASSWSRSCTWSRN